MAHFNLTFPLGAVFLSELSSAQLDDLDSKTERAINGDEGGTWAPAGVIIIGGAGIQVTGFANLDDLDAVVPTGRGIVIQSGGTLTLDAGSTTSSAGAFTFAGSTWPLVASRTITRDARPLVLGTTHLNAASGAVYAPDASQRVIATDGPGIAPAVFLNASDAASRSSFLEIPSIQEMDGQELVSVRLSQESTGVGSSAGTLTLPRYRVVRLSGGGAPAALSSWTNSGYSQATWLSPNRINATVTLTSPETVDLDTYQYAIEIEHPYNAAEPATHWIYQVRAVYTVTSIRK